METDETEGTANTAGNISPKAETPTPPREEGHDELLPVVSPVLLENPEIEAAVAPEKKTPEAPALPVQNTQTPPADLSGTPLSKAIDALNSGNAVAAAAEVKKNPPPQVKKEDPDPTPHAEFAESPLQRSAREIGLDASTITSRPAIPPREVPKAPSVAPDDGLPKIRTYANDISEEIRKRNTTLTSIVSAEQSRTIEEGPREDDAVIRQRKIRGRIILIGASLLVFLGIGIMSVAFMLTRPVVVTGPHTSFIPTNHTETVEHDPEEPLATTLGRAKNSATLNLGEVEELVVTENGTPIDAPTLLTLLGAPSELIRNATGVMVGAHAFDHTQPFLIITVSTYDRAFEAMLGWETRMDEGLGDFFKPASLSPTSIASTPPALTFSDRTLQNIDIRESQLAWHIVYSFPRRDLIIITTNESTLREIITRLSLQSSK